MQSLNKLQSIRVSSYNHFDKIMENDISILSESKSNETKSFHSQNASFIIDFLENHTKCQQKNDAIMVCVNQNCYNENPLMCFEKSCKCLDSYKNCNIKTVASITSSIQSRKSSIQQLKDHIQDINFDFVEKASEIKHHLIQRIEKGSIHRLLEKDFLLENEALMTLQQKKVSGATISEYERSQNQLTSDKNIYEIKKIISQIYRTYGYKKLRYFEEYLSQIIDPKTEVISIRSKLKHPVILAEQNSLIYEENKNFNKKVVCLIEPSIREIAGKSLKLRVRVTSNNTQSWIGIGLGLKNFLNRQNFYLSNQTALSGCYMISNRGLVTAHHDLERNGKFDYGIVFREGDVICVEFDKISLEIHFRNERTKMTTVLDIKQVPELEVDECHFCIGLYAPGNAVELLSLESEMENYKIQLE